MKCRCRDKGCTLPPVMGVGCWVSKVGQGRGGWEQGVTARVCGCTAVSRATRAREGGGGAGSRESRCKVGAPHGSAGRGRTGAQRGGTEGHASFELRLAPFLLMIFRSRALTAQLLPQHRL